MGKPDVRNLRGGAGNVAYGGTVNPPRYRKGAAGNPPPTGARASALPDGVHHDRLVEAWDSLNDDQKNFFDMKNGLPDELSAVEDALFKDLSQGDRQVLSHGFGENVYKCWTHWNVQAKTELLRRSQGDLERGIELIRKEV